MTSFFLFLFWRGSCGELLVECQFSLKGYWLLWQSSTNNFGTGGFGCGEGDTSFVCIIFASFWVLLVLACPILYICIYMLWGHFNYMISNFFFFWFCSNSNIRTK